MLTKRGISFCLATTICILLSLPVMAQRTVSGTIRSDADKELLIGATVTVKENRKLGATTDESGHYTLRLPDNKEYTLEAAYIGYATKECRLNARPRGTVDFVLEEDIIGMETVVVTGTRTPRLLKDAPIVTRVITAADIRKVDATNIGDLLQAQLPGIEFSYSMDQQVNLNLQGFGGNSILFLVDGERLAGETLDNVDYSRLNLDNVERIEIIRGAASSLYGSNAVGGVVNLITRDSKEPWNVNLNGRYGAHNDQRYGGNVSFNSGKFSNAIHVQHTSADAVDLGENGDYTRIYASKTWNFKEQLVFTPVDKMKLTAKAGYFFREREKTVVDADRYRDYSGSLKGSYSFNKKNNLEVSYVFDQYDKSDFDGVKRLDIRDYSNVQHTLRALYSHTFFGKNTLIVGGDYMRDYLMSYQFTNEAGSYAQYTADAFAQFEINPTDFLNITTSLRYDYFSEAKAQNFSPKLGLMYKLGNCSLRGSYAVGFRAPTLKEMYMNFDMASIFMIYGNKNLKSETSQNFSLSAEYIKSRYNFTVSGYYNIVDNRIGTAWDNSLGGMVYTNIAKIDIAGLNVDASAKYPCGVGIRLSYAYTYEHVKDGGINSSGTRPHSATLNLEYGKDWKHYGFDVVLNGRVLSETEVSQYINMASPDAGTYRTEYPAYTIWKLNVSQRVWKGVSVNLTVDNLLNYRPSYYYSSTPSTTGTTLAVGVSLDVDKFFK